MSNVWVYKFDGKIQCDAESREIPLDEMRKQLVALVGVDNVLSMKKEVRQMVQLCGMPTGTINAFEITPAGWARLESGFVGKQGFERLDDVPQESGSSINLGRLIGSLTASNPQFVQELVGHPLRVYQTGDALTLDWRPDRCNIERGEQNRIGRVWFG